MITHNVSAETFCCACCDNQAVPEAGYATCTRGRGLTPELLAPLLASWRIPQVYLLATKTVGRAPKVYRVNAATALALRQSADVGLHLHPGERVRYLIRHAKAANAAERVRGYPGSAPMTGVMWASTRPCCLTHRWNC